MPIPQVPLLTTPILVSCGILLWTGMVTQNFLEPTVAVDLGAVQLPKLTVMALSASTKSVRPSSLYIFNSSTLAPVYSMAQASKAILPRDVGGPWGKRIGVSVGGSSNWALVVGAYVTGRVSSSDWLRYSLVVLNCEL
jgi:hypothetical protein